MKGFVNTITTHITNGNKNEDRLVNILGGTVIETESERIRRVAWTQAIIKMGQEYRLGDEEVLRQLQENVGISLEQAKACLEQYGKQLV